MKKKIEVKVEELRYWDGLLEKAEIDFEKEELEEDATLFSRTVKFDDGTTAELKVCSGQTNLWSEAVWFDKDGYEICCTDANYDDLEGEWFCDENSDYDFEVVPV